MNQITINLPQEIEEKIKDKIIKNSSLSLEQYIINLIKKDLAEKKDSYSENEEEKVKDRLKSLGYLD